jgi:hypothetical protein
VRGDPSRCPPVVGMDHVRLMTLLVVARLVEWMIDPPHGASPGNANTPAGSGGGRSCIRSEGSTLLPALIGGGLPESVYQHEQIVRVHWLDKMHVEPRVPNPPLGDLVVHRGYRDQH